MNKQGISGKAALEVVSLKAFKNIKAKYGDKLDEKVFVGFLVQEIKDYFIINIKVSRHKEIENLLNSQ